MRVSRASAKFSWNCFIDFFLLFSPLLDGVVLESDPQKLASSSAAFGNQVMLAHPGSS